MSSKLLPFDLDTEQAVLGAALFNSEASDIVAGLFKGLFYDDRHAEVWACIKHLRQNSNPVDLMTLRNSIRENKLDQKIPVSYLTQMMNTVVSSANLNAHIEILYDHYCRRKLIDQCSVVVDSMYQVGDVPNAIESIDQALVDLVQFKTKRQQRSMTEIALSYLEQLEKRMVSGDSILGIPSGISSLDLVTAGWQPGEVTLVAGRPAMGKTDVACNFAYQAALMGHKAGIIELEMTENKLFSRIMSIETGLSKDVLQKGEKEQIEEFGLSEIHQSADKVIRSGLRILDVGSASFYDIKRHCSQLVRMGCELIIIDYIGLIALEVERGKTLTNALGEVSRGIKMNIAKDMNVSVIGLHQLNRNVESRGGDKRPILSDLRDSGNLEQDADRVIFLYRPEYYGFDTDDQGNSTHGLLEFIVAKNREGQTGTVRTFYDPSVGKIQDWFSTAINGSGSF